MTLSKKTKSELIAEVNKLQEENKCLKKESKKDAASSGGLNLTDSNLMAFLSHSKNYVILIDPNRNIIDINKVEKALSRDHVIGLNVAHFVGKESEVVMEKALNTCFKTKIPQIYKTSRQDENGLARYYVSTVTPIVDNGIAIAAIIDAAEVTSEVNMQNALKQSEEKFRRLAQNAHDIVYRYSLSPEARHEYMSPSVESITGYKVEDYYNDPHLGFKIIHPDDLHLIKALQDVSVDPEKEKSNFKKPRVLRWIRKDGEIIWTETIETPILDADGNLIAVEGISRDITARKKMEDILNVKSQNDLLSKHADIVPGLVFQYQTFPDGKYMFPFASKKMLDVFEVTPEEVDKDARKVFDRIYAGDKAALIISVEQSMKTLKDWDLDFRVDLPEKGLRWLSGHAKPSKLNDGSVAFHGYLSDVTSHKEIIQKMNDSLHEKEILLKEVHHRVKNNLQVISSILNLQSSYVKDESTLNVLQESQNRIKSMAFIHESLYQTDDFSRINFSDYVVNLLQNLMQSYSKLNQPVKLNTDLQTIFLDLDSAIPCGLIINEIISNALKYAFEESKGGDEISIQMKKEKGDVKLIIEDNGVGLPENVDYMNTESLGLQLVVALTEQLSGTIVLDSRNGARYTIIFASKD